MGPGRQPKASAAGLRGARPLMSFDLSLGIARSRMCARQYRQSWVGICGLPPTRGRVWAADNWRQSSKSTSCWCRPTFSWNYGFI